MTTVEFQSRQSVEQVEEGTDFAPQFGAAGLMPCITSDARTGDVLMLGWMNNEALRLTIETGEAHYFSRARQVLWRKGATSGLVQKVIDARIDGDQDAIWLKVSEAGSGASCHVGYRPAGIGRRQTGSLELRGRSWSYRCAKKPIPSGISNA